MHSPTKRREPQAVPGRYQLWSILVFLFFFEEFVRAGMNGDRHTFKRGSF